MIVRGGRANPRSSAKPNDPQRPNSYQTASFPAPTLGWIANGNLAMPQPGGASVLENFFPTATGAVLRRGTEAYVTVGEGPITSLFSYVVGSVAQMFAATATGIFDITTQIFPVDLIDDTDALLVTDLNALLIGYETPPPSNLVAGLTGGDWSVVQFATPGGVFLRAVNGVDTPLVYDGTTWATTPAITGTGLDPTTLSNVWVSDNRLWFVQKDTLNAWYLPVSSIGGTAVVFPLGGVFPRGGSLLFGHSWSLDTGGGLSQNCAFVSTEGEVAIYKGSDPGTAATWSLVGVYRIGRPLGPKAFIPAGGDIAIATDLGLVPLSQALQKDYAALSPSAVSYSIETIWNQAVAERQGVPWNCAVWSTNQMVVVAPPVVNDALPEIYVANSRTGAWAKFSNWNATCLLEFKGRFFFGSNDGLVVEANVTGLDLGVPYTGSFVPLFDSLGSMGMKTTGMARAVLRSAIPVVEKVAAQADYKVDLPSPPDAAIVGGISAWGVGLWGEAVWGASPSLNTYERWHSAPINGYTVAPSLQVTSGSLVPLDVGIVRMDVTYQSNDTVV